LARTSTSCVVDADDCDGSSAVDADDYDGSTNFLVKLDTIQTPDRSSTDRTHNVLELGSNIKASKIVEALLDEKMVLVLSLGS
jgi:hypothetical protein